jgi:hypothetical protein
MATLERLELTDERTRLMPLSVDKLVVGQTLTLPAGRGKTLAVPVRKLLP